MLGIPDARTWARRSPLQISMGLEHGRYVLDFAALGVTITPLTLAQTENEVHEVLRCLAQTHGSLI
jgi:hypothetical protein